MKEEAPSLIEDFRWMLPPREAASLWAVWLGVGLLLVVIAIALFLLLRKKRLPLPFLTPPSPYERALRALEDILRLMREGTDVEFARQVSQIIREYIQERFGLRAPHRSTEEFLREAAVSSLLAPDEQGLLRDFLGECDRAKFARRRIDYSRREALRASAVHFVRSTIPQPTAATAS